MNLGPLALADLLFLLAEQAAVLLLGQALFPEVRALWPAAAALVVLGAVLWSQAIARLRAPLLQASAGPGPRSRRPGDATPMRARSSAQLSPRELLAYRTAIRLPIDSLWLRVVLLTSQSALLGFYGVQAHALPTQAVAFLLWTAALVSPLLDAWRALFYERAARRFLERLTLPLHRGPRAATNVQPSWPAEMFHRYLRDSYQSRLLLGSLALLGVSVGLSAALIALSLPLLPKAQTQGGARLLFWAPPVGIALLALGILALRRVTAPLDALLRAGFDAQTDHPALRVVDRLPRFLTVGKLCGVLGTALFFGSVAVFLGLVHVLVSLRFIALLCVELLLPLLAVAYIEWPWHTETLTPFRPLSRPISAERSKIGLASAPVLLVSAAIPLILLLAALHVLLLGWPGVKAWGFLAALCGLLLLKVWLERRLRPLRELTAAAAALAHGTSAPALAPEAPAPREAELIRLHQALCAMHAVLHDRLAGSAKAQVRLESEVADRTAELRRQSHELEEALRLLRQAQDALISAEKMASIGRLLAGIAHEINNPINAVINTANPLRETLHDLAQKPLSTAVDAEEVSELRGMLRILSRGANRVQEIVRALHHYAQGSDETPNPVDIHRVLDEALELLAHPFLQKVEVIAGYKGQEPRFVLGLGSQLQQVFGNLFSNAVHALAQRKVGEKDLRPRLEISVQEQDEAQTLCVSVRDNGPGIPASVLPRIFDPFFTTKDATEGSGLGLSIVHGILARHHGQIRVQTAVGEGSCFTVVLPLAPGL